MITLTDTYGWEFDATVIYNAGDQPTVNFQPKDAINFDCAGVRAASNFMGAAEHFGLTGNWADSPYRRFGPDQLQLLKREIFEKTRKDGRFVTVWVDDDGLPF